MEQNPYGPNCERIDDPKEDVFRLTSALEIEPVATPVKPRPKKPVIPKKVKIVQTKEPELKIAPLPPPPPPPIEIKADEGTKTPALNDWEKAILETLDHKTNSTHIDEPSTWLDNIKDLVRSAKQAGIAIDKQVINKSLTDKVLAYLDHKASYNHIDEADTWLDEIKLLIKDAEEMGLSIDMNLVEKKLKEVIGKHLSHRAKRHYDENLLTGGGLEGLIADAKEIGIAININEVSKK